MKKNATLLILVIIIVSSCTQNEKNYSKKIIGNEEHIFNKNIPSKPNLKFYSTSKFKLNIDHQNSSSFTNIRSFACSDSGSIFVIDDESKIIQFGKNNNIVNSFGRKGKGPGENNNPRDIVILKDTILVTNENRKIVRYSFDGNFIDEFHLKYGVPNMIFPITNTGFLGSLERFQKTNDDLYCVLSISIFTSKFEEIKNLYTKKLKWNSHKLDPFDFLQIYAVGTENLYYTKQSKKDYIINVLDIGGKLKYKIHKNYIKVDVSKEENLSINNYQKKWDMGINNHDYKLSITKLLEDKYGYLWVFSSSIQKNENGKLYVDIFKNGVYLNRIHIDLIENYQYTDCLRYWYYFKNHLIYVYDADSKTIECFDYEIHDM